MLDTTYPTFNGLQVPRNATLIPCSTLEPFNSTFYAINRTKPIKHCRRVIYRRFTGEPAYRKNQYTFLERRCLIPPTDEFMGLLRQRKI
jgi:hypothetical protein